MNDTNGIEIKASLISGKGIFAERPFMAGETVLKWNRNSLVSRDRLETVPPENRHFLVPYDSQNFLLITGPERFINHSCDSNTRVRDFCDVAIRNIAKGEEITADYGLDDSASVGFQCACGAECCRGWIGPAEETR